MHTRLCAIFDFAAALRESRAAIAAAARVVRGFAAHSLFHRSSSSSLSSSSSSSPPPPPPRERICVRARDFESEDQSPSLSTSLPLRYASRRRATRGLCDERGNVAAFDRPLSAAAAAAAAAAATASERAALRLLPYVASHARLYARCLLGRALLIETLERRREATQEARASPPQASKQASERAADTSGEKTIRTKVSNVKTPPPPPRGLTTRSGCKSAAVA